MKISILQLDVKACDLEQNYINVKNMIQEAVKKNTDVICLPELWNTGFLPKNSLDDYCDNDGRLIKNMFQILAKESNVNIVAGSIANKRENKTYNTSFIFDRKGNCIEEYDKIHLFSYANEHKYFEKGNKIVTFDLDNVKCGIIICYDLRFLEIIRKQSLDGIKILFVVAQWPSARIEHWEILNRARAIENQIYVVSANGCGVCENVQYGGNSMIINPSGKVLAKGDKKQAIITYDIDLDEINKIRNKINIYADRREELY